ncbi:hypothetical protein [Pedobacter sp. ASV28]|jgi:hypothetical protein|uniref:hypothetical protein n=1 Tax=Pedobacter sp. ASV28 TaxID=2795123 RepID=UPI0018EC3354|nr:hypothetical protein [Pedobacter sp. ASV28]
MKDFNQHIKKMALHLSISEEYINNLFLDTAGEFLKDYSGSANAAQIWKATPEFWTWWQQIWTNRDKMILRRYPQRIGASNRKELYHIWHSPKYMHIKPNSRVYDGFIRTMKQQNIPLKQMT